MTDKILFCSFFAFLTGISVVGIAFSYASGYAQIALLFAFVTLITSHLFARETRS